VSDEDEEATLTVLDEAIRAHAADVMSSDGEVIVSWLALAAVRRYDGGGVVIQMPSSEVMPWWEARGILHEALAFIDRQASGEISGDSD
jgi:hypothetical protein